MQADPFFIIGNPRSGTTLLRLMLTSHSRLIVPPECGFAVWLYEKYKGWQEADSKNKLSLLEFINDLGRSRKFETWKLDVPGLQEFIKFCQPQNYSVLVSNVYKYYAVSNRKQIDRWGDKNNFYIQHIKTIAKIFPSSQFIHLIRDGRDVACSYKEIASRSIESEYAPRLPDQIEAIAHQWQNNIESAIASFSDLGWNNVLEVRFEDLVTRPEDTLHVICEFLDEEFDVDMLEYHTRNRQLQLEPTDFLRWKEKTIEKPLPQVVGRHRLDLSITEKQCFEDIAQRTLDRYAYE